MRGQNPKKQPKTAKTSSFHLGKPWVETAKALPANSFYLHQGRILRFM
jgi:hypothetical protein